MALTTVLELQNSSEFTDLSCLPLLSSFRFFPFSCWTLTRPDFLVMFCNVKKSQHVSQLWWIIDDDDDSRMPSQPASRFIAKQDRPIRGSGGAWKVQIRITMCGHTKTPMLSPSPLPLHSDLSMGERTPKFAKSSLVTFCSFCIPFILWNPSNGLQGRDYSLQCSVSPQCLWKSGVLNEDCQHSLFCISIVQLLKLVKMWTALSPLESHLTERKIGMHGLATTRAEWS